MQAFQFLLTFQLISGLLCAQLITYDITSNSKTAITGRRNRRIFLSVQGPSSLISRGSNRRLLIHRLGKAVVVPKTNCITYGYLYYLFKMYNLFTP